MMKLAEKIVSGLRVQLSIRTAVTLLIGLGLFGVYGGFPEPWDHFVRDVGMAFLIAAIVTEIYERYAREAAAAESAEQIVSKLISDIVDPGVWRELREQILEKVAIRQSTTVQLKLGPAISPNDNRHRLWVNLTYRLTSLRSRVKDVKVVHFLDAYMRDSSLGLPRFIRIVIDGRVESLAASQDRFEKKISLRPRGESDVAVIVEREEIVYVPGAYSLLVSDLTLLESVALWEKPDDTAVVLNCMFDECPLDLHRAYTPKRFLLPGQALEFRFSRNEQNEVVSTSS